MNRLSLRASATLLLLFVAAGEAKATLQNGDFTSGWDGWSGSLSEFDDSGGLVAVRTVDPAAQTNYYRLLDNGLGQLQLNENAPEIGAVDLFQTFALDDVSHAVTVSFEWNWDPSWSDYDLFSMRLELTDSTTGQTYNFLDSLSGGTTEWASADLQRSTFDIAGGAFGDSGSRDLTLSFGITDIDFDVTDVLQIGRIEVTEHAAPVVPLPSSLVLFLTGLGGLGLIGRRRVAR